ncbi:LysR substrate-binding domain-containing protein, partial [Klebsiella michiganensis]|uniref:LysR substrate-binding domain-containing protein n=1 Tax=Klebsiella michiganensis TaxID=1134687 RepID=UPI0021F11C09
HQGWDITLILNVDATFPFPLLAPSIAAFYRQHHATRLEFRRDTPGANWQMLMEWRADLLLVVLGDPPALSGCGAVLLGEVAQAFVVAPRHPLAQIAGPLGWRPLRRHRALVADRAWPQIDAQDRLAEFDLSARMNRLQSCQPKTGKIAACPLSTSHHTHKLTSARSSCVHALTLQKKNTNHHPYTTLHNDHLAATNHEEQRAKTGNERQQDTASQKTKETHNKQIHR